VNEKAAVPDWWQPYAAQHPRWNVWRGVNGMLYASLPKSSPPLVVRGQDPMDLRNEVVRAEADRRSWWLAK
jgi:hypothetical protein